MEEFYNNQRGRNDISQLDIHKGNYLAQSYENDGSKSIDILNSDCLEQIFKYLPIIDLFKVQRVCKYWWMVSLDVCRRITRLDMSRDVWGIKSKNNIHIDFDVLAKMLHICGQNLNHIGLSNDEEIYSVECRRIHVKSIKNVWILIRNKCPELTSIDFGLSRSVVALKFVSHSFKDLTYFKMKEFTEPGKSPLIHETHLCDLFANNQQLKRVEFFDVKLTTECLTKLNPNTFVQLTLDYCKIQDSEHLVKALKSLKNLQKLRITRCTCLLQDIWINSVFEALTSASSSLKHLEFDPYDTFELLNQSYIGKLKHLEFLDIAGDCIIGEHQLKVITECCTKLKTLRTRNSRMIGDMEFEKIAHLPKLKNVVLDNLSNLTGDSLGCMMNIVNLEIRGCANFHNSSILNFIQNSQNIRLLKIVNCPNIKDTELIEEVEQLTNNNIELVIDSSETSDDYLECIFTFTRINGNITKTTNKLCNDCFFKRRDISDCHLCCNIVELNL